MPQFFDRLEKAEDKIAAAAPRYALTEDDLTVLRQVYATMIAIKGASDGHA